MEADAAVVAHVDGAGAATVWCRQALAAAGMASIAQVRVGWCMSCTLTLVRCLQWAVGGAVIAGASATGILAPKVAELRMHAQ